MIARGFQLTPGRALFGWLVLLTLYRLLVIPHLGITLYVDEAQYWTWAQHPDWGYYSKPPVIAWLIAFTTGLFGDGILGIKLAGMLLYPATAWIVFVLGRELFNERIALRCAVAFSLLPFVSGLGLFVSTDAPLLFFWALGVLCLNRALTHDDWRDWLLTGAALGLGIMSKYTMVVFAACALLYLLIDREHRQHLMRAKPWAALLLAALIVLPNLLWNYTHDFPTLHHTADITHVEGGNSKSGNAGEFLGAQWISLGPLLALAWLASLSALWRNRRSTPHMLLHCFSLPLLLLVLLQSLRSQANGNWAAPAFVTASMLAVVWLDRFKLRWTVIALGLNAIVMLAAYHIADVYRLTGKPMPAKYDVLKRARGWDQLAQQLRPILLQYQGVTLLTDSRALTAHLLYELRDFNPPVAAWKPTATPRNHYQLSIPYVPRQGDAVLFITQTDPSPISNHFERKDSIAHIKVISPTVQRQLDVYLLQGFKDAPAAPAK